MKLQGTDGMTHAELKTIPYTRIETAKNIKIKYSSSKSKKHKNGRKGRGSVSNYIIFEIIVLKNIHL